MKINYDKISWRLIDGQIYIVTPKDRTLHTLNPIATSIWQLLDQNKSEDEITKQIIQKYEVTDTEARKDLQQLFNELLEKEIIRRR